MKFNQVTPFALIAIAATQMIGFPSAQAATSAEKAAGYFRTGKIPKNLKSGLKVGLTWLCKEHVTVDDLTDEEMLFSTNNLALYSFTEDNGDWTVESNGSVLSVSASPETNSLQTQVEHEGDFIESFRVSPAGNLVAEISLKKPETTSEEFDDVDSEDESDMKSEIDSDIEVSERPESQVLPGRYVVAYRFCEKKLAFDAEIDDLDQMDELKDPDTDGDSGFIVKAPRLL